MSAPITEDVKHSNSEDQSQPLNKSRNKTKEVVLFAAVSSISMVTGFGMAYGRAKKKVDLELMKGTTQKLESPTMFGLRALAVGTCLSVSTFGLLFFAVYKLFGAKDFKDFVRKIDDATPKVPKQPSKGRTEFESLRDLADYCIKGGKG